MANLELKEVSKLYPSGTLALYKANLTLGDSEFIAVVGGEKSGKSTFLRVIAGLEDATEGQIIIGGKEVTEVASRDRDIAMIFQGNTLYPTMTVFDNMAYGLQLRKAPRTLIEQRVKAASAILGLDDVLYRKPKILTTEQKQEVAFGRAIAREPKLYLFDDPIAGIAPETRAKLRSVLINLQMRVKGTFIYATKNVNEALTMATRIIVMREGFIQQIDTPANLYEYPENAFVAFTIGSPTVNFINGKVVKDGGVFIESQGVRFALPENIVSRFTSLDEYADTDKKVILGIRPEDMGVGENALFEATVAASQKIGETGYAECDFKDISVLVRADGLKKGDKAGVTADLTHAFIFDAETRLTLLERDGRYKKTAYADADFKPLAFDEEEQIREKLRLPDGTKKKKK